MGDRTAAFEAVFKPVQPPTTFEETVERLGTAIRLGLLGPGTQLPPERDLAGQLCISRSTLRQGRTPALPPPLAAGAGADPPRPGGASGLAGGPRGGNVGGGGAAAGGRPRGRPSR